MTRTGIDATGRPMTLAPTAWDRVAAGQAGGVSWIFARVIERVAELAGQAGAVQPGLVVDAGCGSGRLLARLTRAGHRAVGVDADVAMVRAAGAAGAVGCLVADVTRLPFPDGSIALITATSLIGCLASPGPFLAEAWRCLAPGGLLILTATNSASRLLRMNYRLPRRWVAPGAAGAGGTFARFTREELVMQLEGAGFRIEQLHACNFVLHLGPWLLPPRGLARRLDALGRDGAHAAWARNFIAVARKA